MWFSSGNLSYQVSYRAFGMGPPGSVGSRASNMLPGNVEEDLKITSVCLPNHHAWRRFHLGGKKVSFVRYFNFWMNRLLYNMYCVYEL